MKPSAAVPPRCRTASRPRRRPAGVGLVAGLLATALLVTVGCGRSGGRATGAGSSGPKEVVLVTYDAFALPKSAAAEFRRRTGARIKVVASGDAGAVLSRSLLSAGAPEGDVLFGVDNVLAGRVTSADLLEPYRPAAAANVPARYRLGGRLGARLTPVDTGDVCVNVDRDWFARRRLAPPATLEDLADPRYRNLLVVESPVTSSPGLALLVGSVAKFGEPGWKDWWTRLRANGVRVRPSWDDAYFTDYTVAGGDRPLVLSYASSPPAEVVLGEGKRTAPASTVATATCVAQVEYAGVLRGAPHPELARRLVDFLLDPAWQSALPLSNFVFPVVPGVELPPEFTKWAQRAPAPLTVDAATVDARRDQWVEQWRSLLE